jgi:hypothetical protein
MTKEKICACVVVIAVLLFAGSFSSIAFNVIQSGEAAGGRVSNDCVPLSASGNNVYVSRVSNKTGNWDVMFSHLAIRLTWAILPNSTSLDPHIAAYGDNVYVSWHDNQTGNWDTYVKTSKDRGQTFGDIIKINGTGIMPQIDKIGVYPGLHPLEDVPLEATHVAAYGDNVYVTSWDKKTGNWEVFLARSTDNGETFGDSVNLSNTTDKSSDAAHNFALADNLYMTWWETSKNGTTVPVFRASNDNGETFGPVLKLPTNGTIGEG